MLASGPRHVLANLLANPGIDGEWRGLQRRWISNLLIFESRPLRHLKFLSVLAIPAVRALVVGQSVALLPKGRRAELGADLEARAGARIACRIARTSASVLLAVQAAYTVSIVRIRWPCCWATNSGLRPIIRSQLTDECRAAYGLR